MLDKVKPAAIGARRAPVFVCWQVGGAEDSPSQVLQQAIRADLIGSDTCIALGLTVQSNTPVLEICRQLVAAGHNPAALLEAYHGKTLCLRIRSIGDGARLEINGEGTGFRRRRQPVAAPPMRFSEGGGT
jgi:hypothetical protein